ncbi:type IV pilus modification protein PilV [Amphritea pacifica]|uniref:type IV pilus modification protein PilV n=1 Tax=Amphritea pacifica TaxID=2811233 RepID=UPI00196302D2|nr:type IV pilus modification protein PilV [Amphritea pacifica]MBN1008034.1 type IV pilus modification protein PilV [Amphritea pacifica]
MSVFVNMRNANERGSSLIEVLIAVVIISVGLLSVAALQTMALKSNQGSYYRSQATFLAYDLADRIRAAPDSALNGEYDDGQGGDRDEWDNKVTAALGADAVGVVTWDKPNRQATITITWNDNRARIRAENDVDDATLASFSYFMEF